MAHRQSCPVCDFNLAYHDIIHTSDSSEEECRNCHSIIRLEWEKGGTVTKTVVHRGTPPTPYPRPPKPAPQEDAGDERE